MEQEQLKKFFVYFTVTYATMHLALVGIKAFKRDFSNAPDTQKGQQEIIEYINSEEARNAPWDYIAPNADVEQELKTPVFSATTSGADASSIVIPL